MYECPNCGSNLKFDITAQQMLCSYCGTTLNPYSIQCNHNTGEDEAYDVTVFTCSQCGAELLSEDTTAATFCSFCGSTAILDSRIGRGRRPVHIIPFSKTKEDCKASYARMMRRAVFAPKALKDQEYIEKFRGIYMPYWVYSFEKKGEITFRGSKSRQKGDYLITKHYDLTSEVDVSYKGISYDAAAAFSDDLSGAIAPYDITACKPFTPPFLSGFYADSGDVDSFVYRQDAGDLAADDAFGRLAGDRVCSRYHVREQRNSYSLKNALRPECTAAESAMFPVWFLSYRKDDRVVYAVVNGQTGKAAADLPVDRKKYVIGSLLLAIPLFLILNLQFTITPGAALILSALLAFVCALVSFSQMRWIKEKEMRENDKGYLFSKQKNENRQGSNPIDDSWVNYAETGQRQTTKRPDSTTILVHIIIGTMLFSFVLPPVMAFAAFFGANAATLTTIFFVFTAVVFLVPMYKRKKNVWKISLKEIFPVLAKPFAAILLAIIILLWNPVSDLYYYGGSILSMGAVIWTLMDIIGRYNVLTTRKLPQFNRRGGDENA
ncbi:MAG: zinc ribbon domain-containing protein [Lachnospiraceae bacterium]|nr:zinc ribbon domain-containing protein [Lachnospiraceae bacterium]